MFPASSATENRMPSHMLLEFDAAAEEMSRGAGAWQRLGSKLY
jgi:hypothetical protein